MEQYDYSKLLPALLDEKDIKADDLVDDFFSHFGGQYSSNKTSTTYVGFLNGETEVRVHLVANRLSVELTQCTVPSDELIADIISFFTHDAVEASYTCTHWMESPTAINFQYYWEEF